MMPFYSDDDIQMMQDSERDVQLATAQRLGVGGQSWIVDRPSGNGPVEPVTCFVVQRRQREIALQVEGFRAEDEWSVIAPAGTDLRTDDEIESDADGSRYLLLKQVPVLGYLRWTAEPAPQP